ncbi:MAG: GtrA family protein [Endozoicomonadaceae bacterium]|nr:GtrA family protein [Endozoicomonadaceae bacterium]MCY4329577.1 GtrA family protein [Endozoicomonadaceae bacterium]
MKRYKLSILKRQILCFGLVGALAALVNMLLVWCLVAKVFYLHPLQANIFAFFVAFWISYMGHSRFTFNEKQHKISHTAPKFFLVAITSFALNEILYFIVLHFTPIPYLWALLLVLSIVPAFTFILSRYWAFG